MVKAPPDEIVKKEPSVPLFDHVTDSFAVKVWTTVAVSAIEIELVAPVADDGPVIVGAVVSGFVQAGEVYEEATDPNSVTRFPDGDISLKRPATDSFRGRRSLEFATGAMGLLETVKAEV